MKTDPGLAAVRKVRTEISRKFDNDPARLVEYYLEMQTHYQGGRLIQGPGAPTFDESEAVPSAADLDDAAASARRRG